MVGGVVLCILLLFSVFLNWDDNKMVLMPLQYICGGVKVITNLLKPYTSLHLQFTNKDEWRCTVW